MKAAGKVYRFLSTPLALGLMMVLTGSVLAGKGSDSKDWPKWRGANMDGKALQDDVFRFDEGYGLKIGWKKPLGSGYSSISVADGRAVTMYSDSTYDYVVAFDAEDGSELWRYTLGETFEGHDGSHNGQISTPTIDGNEVYVYARTGELLALNASNGQKIWSKNVKAEIDPLEPFHGFGTSPIVMGDLLFCQTGGQKEHTFCGFDKNTGELLWSAKGDTVNYQSPVHARLLGEDQIVSVTDHQIFGLHPENGEVLWQYRHNGQWNSFNPVVVGEDKIFLNHNFQRSALIQLSKQNGAYEANEVWNNRNIRSTFNTSVYHEGHLYGYSGRFLTCVDAATGETVWKSRPPGDGFMILVDDHLVILTKRGTLHVAKASTEDYVEMASLEVFEGLTWTPPSFANGSIYVRNLFEIARVDVAKVDETQLTLDEPELEVVNPDGEFAKFVKRVEAAPDDQKQKLVAAFLAEHPNSPIIEGDRFAHIVFHGEAKDVAVLGDMLNVNAEQALHRIDGTDFFFASFELAPNAQIAYQLRKDFDSVITDPRNPNGAAPGGPATLQGDASLLRMPEAKVVDHFRPRENVAKGTIETFEFASDILDNSRNVHVYLPAGYAQSESKYPVLFANYGRGAKDFQAIPVTLDNLIADKKIQPVIAVFVEAPNSFAEYARNQKDQHAQMYAEELVAMIDKKYRTIATRESRAIMGGDEGGYAAYYAAFKYPQVFANAASQSGHLMPNAGGTELRELIASSDAKSMKLYQDWGVYDLNYNANLRWTDLNRDFNKFLKEKGYEVGGGELSQGFGWASWRNRTDQILMHFFGMKHTRK